MAVLPGLILALVLAFAGQYLSELISIDLMGLPKSPVSAIMMAIILGIIIRNYLPNVPVISNRGPFRFTFPLMNKFSSNMIQADCHPGFDFPGHFGFNAYPEFIFRLLPWCQA